VAAEAGAFVQLFGLEVHDQASYAEYRARMTPLLHAHGGSFGIDLEVARVLKGPVDVALNRVFTIEFPDRAASVRFFANDEYRAVRREWFEPAVGHVARLAEWHAEAPAQGAGS
jgi:uncharacterized protein (DUF1330 family)